MFDSSFSSLDLFHASSSSIGTVLEAPEQREDATPGGFLADGNLSSSSLMFVDPLPFQPAENFQNQHQHQHQRRESIPAMNGDFSCSSLVWNNSNTAFDNFMSPSAPTTNRPTADDILEAVAGIVVPDVTVPQLHPQRSILPQLQQHQPQAFSAAPPSMSVSAIAAMRLNEQQQVQQLQQFHGVQGQGPARRSSLDFGADQMLQAAELMNINPRPIATNNAVGIQFGAAALEGSFSNRKIATNLVEERLEKISLMEEDLVPAVPNAASMERSASESATATVVDLAPERQESPSASAATKNTDGTTTADGKNGEVAPAISAYQSGRWQQRFNELCEYRNLNGHCLVPSQWSENPQLSQWVKRQRYQYKLKREGQHSTMTDERIKLLEDKGFVWDSHSAFWEERLNELIQFSTRHGHCNVPTKYPDNPELAVWAKCQRRHFKLFITKGPKKSSMTMERIAKLTNVGFVFDPREFKKRLAATGASANTSGKVGTKKSKSVSLSSMARASRMVPC